MLVIMGKFESEKQGKFQLSGKNAVLPGEIGGLTHKTPDNGSSPHELL
jgi:hypothetical protein